MIFLIKRSNFIVVCVYLKLYNNIYKYENAENLIFFGDFDKLKKVEYRYMCKKIIERAKWISADRDCVSPVFRRVFNVQDVTSCKLYVTGLGYFHATINGKNITEDMFVPVQSDYEKRDLQKLTYPIKDTFAGYRIYYLNYDILPFLKEGENVLEIQLGNGWYWQAERKTEGELSYSKTLKTLYAIEICDKNGQRDILSDGSELWHESNLTYNNIFIGETVDFRVNANELPRYNVKIVEKPNAELCEQKCPSDRIIRTIKPILVSEKNGKRIYDAGENISGTVRVTLSAERGSETTLRFAENLIDGELDFLSTGGKYNCVTVPKQIMTDRIIASGKKEVFEPKFVWHAFRYFEVVGPADELEVLVIHANTPVISEFESNNEALNWLYDAFVRTQLNNMHGGVPMDCPHRERLGYTGDGQVCATAAMLTLDCREFYKKWIQDILDCQCSVSGHVQHTTPFMGGGGGPGGWGGAIVLVPWNYYKIYGDKDMLALCHKPIEKWIGYLLSRSEKGLVVREEEGGWCLGDWCVINTKSILPAEFVNTYYAIKQIEIYCQISEILGKKEKCEEFLVEAKNMRNALCHKYFDDESGEFCSGIEGANIFAADIGLGDARLKEAIKKKYTELDHFDTGMFSTSLLLEYLLDNNMEDIAFKLLNSDKLGSFLYMKNKGATTLWEGWEGDNSHNHPLLGGCVSLLFSHLLGIRQTSDSAGYGKIVIKPVIPTELSYIKGRTVVNSGEIGVDIKKENKKIIFNITVPANIESEFVYNEKTYVLQSGFNQIIIEDSNV